MEALLDLDRSQPALGAQLTVALRAAIATGRLVSGARLPSSRELAAQLRVSRGVVVAAYEQLIAEGRLVARRGSGTLVATAPPASGHSQAAEMPGESIDLGGPALLRPGVPDLGQFPRAAWTQAYQRMLRTTPDAELGYGDPGGARRLRMELAAYLGRVRAARLAPDDLVVTTGAAQAFALVARAVREAGGEAVAMEEPGSPAIRGHLLAHGLRLVPVRVDADGIDVDALEQTRVSAVLVTPAHHFPTGVVLAPARRAALVNWARRSGGLIVEDDYDAEFRYDRDPVGCLQGLAPDVVAHIGSVSKALAPGLRLGWLASPPGWLDSVRAAKLAADIHGPVLEQLCFAELLAAGGYDRHLRRARRAYRCQRDALVAALHAYLPGAPIRGVAAGLHLTVELGGAGRVDDVALVDRANADGLGPLALSTTWLGPADTHGLVLGYAGQHPDRISEAVARLAALIDHP
jgi:GntR family transcriptional regulator/MocR family aminotransferase